MFGNKPSGELCGLYFLDAGPEGFFGQSQIRRYLPLLSLSAHATVLSSVSRTKLTQIFTNTSTAPVSVRYTFPLYDGVSVVGFTCTINNDRVIRGLVKEKHAARETFNQAVSRGETAGLLEQLPDASDVFTTTIGNVPASAEIRVDLVVLGELKHDAEVDGIRYTLPTRIAPRYGPHLHQKTENHLSHDTISSVISITVDVEMQAGSAIKSLVSPSHPIGITIGSSSSAQRSADAVPRNDAVSRDGIPAQQPQLASATLSLGTTSLDKDFVLQIMATNISDPVAVLEPHPTISGQRALMTTLVPKFNLPSERPEIVFVCDQSGSMEGQKIRNLKSALQLFLKSLPVGVKFNICSFGSRHSFLFPEGSRTYDADSLNNAMQAVGNIYANYGGTELLTPIKDTFDKRNGRLNLEVFVLTDGQIWNQEQLFEMVNSRQQEAQGRIRVFTLGIGDGASSALIEGLARAGNGFAQTVGDDEKLHKKVVRMLKAALTPHISDYTLEIKYRKSESPGADREQEEDFELIDRVAGLTVDVGTVEKQAVKDDEHDSDPCPDQKKPISLFDPSVDSDEIMDLSLDMPTVSIPRVLQAPFQIPPLFPFNRTNVYLLLSPETADHVPETVILRATSKHGPLVLEIPVTTPTISSGETIHQIAARKATLELEEGRGWIFHAKDRTGFLKNTYPGQFSGMVQREAVRLGVQFQVGGKWCSFVAVEEGSDEVQDMSSGNGTEQRMNRVVKTRAHKKAAGHAISPSSFALPPTSVSDAMASNTAGGLFVSACNRSSQVPSPVGGLFGSSATTAAAPFGRLSSGNETTSSGSLFGGSMTADHNPSPQLFGQRSSGSPLRASQAASLFRLGSNPQYRSDRPDGVFSRASSRPKTQDENQAASVSLSRNAARGISVFGGGGGLFGAQPQANNKKPPSEDMDMAEAGMRSLDDYDQTSIFPGTPMDSSVKHRTSLGTPTPTPTHDAFAPSSERETPLETIVRLQNFAGFWTWSEALVGAVGEITQHVAADRTESSSDAWTTISVLSFLLKQMAAEKESWELMAEKALAWLKSLVISDDGALRMIDILDRELR